MRSIANNYPSTTTIQRDVLFYLSESGLASLPRFFCGSCVTLCLVKFNFPTFYFPIHRTEHRVNLGTVTFHTKAQHGAHAIPIRKVLRTHSTLARYRYRYCAQAIGTCAGRWSRFYWLRLSCVSPSIPPFLSSAGAEVVSFCKCFEAPNSAREGILDVLPRLQVRYLGWMFSCKTGIIDRQYDPRLVRKHFSGTVRYSTCTNDSSSCGAGVAVLKYVT